MAQNNSRRPKMTKNDAKKLSVTDGRTDGPTDRVGYRVACTRLKMFNCSVKEKVRKFYRSTNAILRIDRYSNDMVMLSLSETHCVPILTYDIEMIHVQNADERRQMRVAYNSIFRKLFGYRWSQSVTQLQSFLGRPTWEQLVEKRKCGFYQRILNGQQNSLARALLS